MLSVASVVRRRFYYGWLIVATGFAIQFIIGTINAYGLSLFLKPMTEELAWTRTMVSSVQSVGTIVNGLASPFVGPIIDKRGGRALMILGAVLVGAGCLALGFVQGMWDFILIRSIAIPLGVTGAGALTVNVAVSNWFIRKRGKALSVSLIGVSSGGVLPLKDSSL
ncbi:MAG: MFS transporter [Dehalococcoidia bacterium]|nr:MFS transporter [Dehalococcoidia bacterium]